MRLAGSAPGSSAANVGVTIGSGVAGIALASSLARAGPPLVGTVAVA
ncbi:NADPH-dependent glutamate synthase beta subunit-like oxidoreductase [Streptomyces canus]|nr:NADPH-dependent glutamate synthase beta subunit-like oxidoreductase [Streptomyces canus]